MAFALVVVVGLAIVFGTAAVTAARYGDLPDRIPTHFGLDGTVNRYGPRSMVLMLVLVQAAVAITFGALYAAERKIGILVMGDCMLGIGAASQMLILSTAAASKPRADIRGFLLLFVVLLIVGITASRH
jgi:hypothetical protein